MVILLDVIPHEALTLAAPLPPKVAIEKKRMN